MNIQTKYSVGDHVLVKANKRITITCPFCNGLGHRIIEGEKFYCQNCDEGTINQRALERVQVEGIITGFRYEYKNKKDWLRTVFKK